MTRTAVYHATPNHIVEQPTMEKPDSKGYQRVVHRPFGEVDCFTDNKYYEDLKKYEADVSQCRTIPAHDSARSLWKDGQKLVDGRDYEVRRICGGNNGDGCFAHDSCDKCTMAAFPLPVKSDIPPPASIEEEAAEMYPYADDDEMGKSIIDCMRSAHIRCAGMYTGEIAALKAELSKMWMDYVAIPCRKEGASDEIIDKHWQEFKAKHNL